ncbi:unknown [Clostridium sp. CAG:1193]|nr:unknown [Clostridium sp. CAG:1193]
MKLQRNNKYKNKIAAGLSAIIIASTALTGCGESNIIDYLFVEVTPNILPTDTPSPTSTPDPTPEPTPTIEEDIETLGIINEEVMISDEDRFGLIFRMPNGKEKVVETLYNREGNKYTFYDVFTEIPIVTATNCTQDEHYHIHYDEAEILVPYFEDAKIVMIGVQFDIENYAIAYIDADLEEKMPYFIEKLYGKEIEGFINSEDYSFTKEQLAEHYIEFFPRENRVTAEELQTGLEKDSAKVLK